LETPRRPHVVAAFVHLKEKHMSEPKKPALKPFFTRFLDQQDLRKVSGGGVVVPPIEHTMKYPSDGDEELDDKLIYTTQKFPSDSDESEGL
jgi:hypothetical protein